MADEPTGETHRKTVDVDFEHLFQDLAKLVEEVKHVDTEFSDAETKIQTIINRMGDAIVQYALKFEKSIDQVVGKLAEIPEFNVFGADFRNAAIEAAKFLDVLGKVMPAAEAIKAAPSAPSFVERELKSAEALKRQLEILVTLEKQMQAAGGARSAGIQDVLGTYYPLAARAGKLTGTDISGYTSQQLFQEPMGGDVTKYEKLIAKVSEYRVATELLYKAQLQVYDAVQSGQGTLLGYEVTLRELKDRQASATTAAEQLSMAISAMQNVKGYDPEALQRLEAELVKTKQQAEQAGLAIANTMQKARETAVGYQVPAPTDFPIRPSSLGQNANQLVGTMLSDYLRSVNTNPALIAALLKDFDVTDLVGSAAGWGTDMHKLFGNYLVGMGVHLKEDFEVPLKRTLDVLGQGPVAFQGTADVASATQKVITDFKSISNEHWQEMQQFASGQREWGTLSDRVRGYFAQIEAYRRMYSQTIGAEIEKVRFVKTPTMGELTPRAEGGLATFQSQEQAFRIIAQQYMASLQGKGEGERVIAMGPEQLQKIPFEKQVEWNLQERMRATESYLFRMYTEWIKLVETDLQQLAEKDLKAAEAAARAQAENVIVPAKLPPIQEYTGLGTTKPEIKQAVARSEEVAALGMLAQPKDLAVAKENLTALENTTRAYERNLALKERSKVLAETELAHTKDQKDLHDKDLEQYAKMVSEKKESVDKATKEVWAAEELSRISKNQLGILKSRTAELEAAKAVQPPELSSEVLAAQARAEQLYQTARTTTAGTPERRQALEQTEKEIDANKRLAASTAWTVQERDRDLESKKVGLQAAEAEVRAAQAEVKQRQEQYILGVQARSGEDKANEAAVLAAENRVKVGREVVASRQAEVDASQRLADTARAERAAYNNIVDGLSITKREFKEASAAAKSWEERLFSMRKAQLQTEARQAAGVSLEARAMIPLAQPEDLTMARANLGVLENMSGAFERRLALSIQARTVAEGELRAAKSQLDLRETDLEAYTRGVAEKQKGVEATSVEVWKNQELLRISKDQLGVLRARTKELEASAAAQPTVLPQNIADAQARAQQLYAAAQQTAPKTQERTDVLNQVEKEIDANKRLAASLSQVIQERERERKTKQLALAAAQAELTAGQAEVSQKQQQYLLGVSTNAQDLEAQQQGIYAAERRVAVGRDLVAARQAEVEVAKRTEDQAKSERRAINDVTDGLTATKREFKEVSEGTKTWQERLFSLQKVSQVFWGSLLAQVAYGAMNAVQTFFTSVIDLGYKAEMSLARFEIAVRSTQKTLAEGFPGAPGGTVGDFGGTVAKWTQDIQEFAAYWKIFSTQEVRAGFQGILNVTREANLGEETQRQLMDVTAALTLIEDEFEGDLMKASEAVGRAMSGDTRTLNRTFIGAIKDVDRDIKSQQMFGMTYGELGKTVDGVSDELKKHQIALVNTAILLDRYRKVGSEINTVLETQKAKSMEADAEFKSAQATIGGWLTPSVTELKKVVAEATGGMADMGATAGQVAKLIEMWKVDDQITRMYRNVEALKVLDAEQREQIRLWILNETLVKGSSAGAVLDKIRSAAAGATVDMSQFGVQATKAFTDAAEAAQQLQDKLQSGKPWDPRQFGIDPAKIAGQLRDAWDTRNEAMADAMAEAITSWKDSEQKWHDDQIESEEKHGEKLIEIDEKIAEKRKEAADKAAEDRIKAFDDWRSAIENENFDYASKLRELDRKQGEDGEKAYREHVQKLEEIEIEHQRRLRDIQARFEFDLDAAASERDAKKIALLMRQHTFDVNQENTNNQDRVADENRRFAQQQEENRRSDEEERRRMARDHQAKLDELQKKYQKDLDEIKKALAKQNAEITKEKDKATAAEFLRWGKERRDLWEEWQKRDAQIGESLKKQEDAVEKSFNKQTETVLRNLNDQVTWTQTKMYALWVLVDSALNTDNGYITRVYTNWADYIQRYINSMQLNVPLPGYGGVPAGGGDGGNGSSLPPQPQTVPLPQEPTQSQGPNTALSTQIVGVQTLNIHVTADDHFSETFETQLIDSITEVVDGIARRH